MQKDGIARGIRRAGKKKVTEAREEYRTWTGWLGPERDGRVAALPERLEAEPVRIWKRDLLRSGLGGIAATEKYVVFGDRDVNDLQDVWRCWNAETGETLWEVSALAIGKLDYGNSPRATPLLARKFQGDEVVPGEERAYLLGAFGNLLCVKLATGEVVWRKNLSADFAAEGERPWGYCGSPLLVDGKLIVAPGAAEAALAALDPENGEVLWRASGEGVGHGSFIVAALGGKRQIIGHDATTLGGWNIETGERLWKLTPPAEGDFNVPTPLVRDGQLLVATENNGTRLYAFDDEGRIVPRPVAENVRLRPDMSTPILANGRLFCVNRFLYCLDANDGLKEAWRMRDAALGDYAAAFTDGERLLVLGKGELLLVDCAADKKIIARWKLFDEADEIYARAAIVGGRIYVRGEKSLECLRLE